LRLRDIFPDFSRRLGGKIMQVNFFKELVPTENEGYDEQAGRDLIAWLAVLSA
jgi:hypothetical protein